MVCSSKSGFHYCQLGVSLCICAMLTEANGIDTPKLPAVGAGN